MDKLSKEQRHKNMAAIHGRDTKPEMLVRKFLFSHGFRYRLNHPRLPGKPDIVLLKYKTCIFINGCFWHGHEGCKYYTVPKSNVKFWREKINHNKERDLINNQRLESLSWNVITIWECELKPKKFNDTMAKVEFLLDENQRKWEAYKTHRKEDHLFSREQSRRHREILAQVKAELEVQFHHEVKLSKTTQKEI